VAQLPFRWITALNSGRWWRHPSLLRPS